MAALAFKLRTDAPATHELRLELEIDRAAWPAPHELFMPVWTPGSYLVREYARHLTALTAVDARSGALIEFAKVTKNRWRFALPRTTERVRITWSIHAHELTVRTADVTEDHAFWNAACVFLWPVGAPSLAASIDVTLPRGWQLATPLARVESKGESARLHARDLDDLIDSPCLAGTLRTIPFDAAGKPHAFVLDGLEGVEPPASLVTDTQKVIAEALKVFGGELPYELYEFLSMFADSGRGGLEHLTSSVLLAPRTTFAPRKSYEDFVSLVAHEHFHAWNVKRMRPAELWRFDYESENYTTLLWVAEGFTSYYDDHLCLRAGVLTRDRYLEVLAEGIADLRAVPGRLVHPLALASFDTWIKFYRPDEHSKNSTQSYYTSGALATLCLDLAIRAASDGRRSLDHALADLWRTSFASGRGYTREDVVACLSRAAGRDLAAEVTALVDMPFDPDFDAALAPFGVRIVKKAESAPWLGVQLRSDSFVLASVTAGESAHRAGLAPGDELLAFNGLRITPANWKTTLENLWSPGKSVQVLLARRGRILERTLTPSQTPDKLGLEIVPESSDTQKRLRRAWLCET